MGEQYAKGPQDRAPVACRLAETASTQQPYVKYYSVVRG